MRKIIWDSATYIKISASVIFVFAIFLALWFIFSNQNNGEKRNFFLSESEFVEEVCEHVRLLDGVCVKSGDAVDPKLIGVMIENHYDARPLSGLSQASVVYEVPVEANFVRFLAIFPEDVLAKKVGPVRSARPYYLDWLSEYPDIMYMHVGGSPEALTKIEKYKLFDLNEFYRGWYYWRSDDRVAPHNVYTSQELWAKARKDYGEKFVADTKLDPWQFGTNKPCEIDCVDTVKVIFSGEVYTATWQFNSSTLQYERLELDNPVYDRETTERIVADTLIIQHVHSTVLDNVGRLAIDTVGGGEAEIFVTGNKINGQWRKDSFTSRTKFYKENGEEVVMKAGKIWIEIVNERAEVSY